MLNFFETQTPFLLLFLLLKLIFNQFNYSFPREQLLALDASGKFTKAGVVVKFRNYHYNFQHQFQKMDLGDGNDSDEVSDEDEEGDYGKDEEEERSIYQEL